MTLPLDVACHLNSDEVVTGDIFFIRSKEENPNVEEQMASQRKHDIK